MLSSNSFHWNILGFISCNAIRLHHLQLIIFLQCCEFDAFQKNCETLENDDVWRAPKLLDRLKCEFEVKTKEE
jgi:hypothetical protein